MIDYARYLRSKVTVDERALNQHVWAALAADLGRRPRARLLELGAGIGTMVARLSDHCLLPDGSYHLLDADPNLLRIAKQDYGQQVGGCQLSYLATTIEDFVIGAEPASYDLLLAHAFLDLVQVPRLLPQLLKLLAPGGAFYFTLNFDGSTIMEPAVDPVLDELVERLYHQTMDERAIAGKSAGDSRTGRHLLHHLQAAGAVVKAAGSSDWVVFAGPEGYVGDEAYFLEAILATMAEALGDRPELDRDDFARWHKTRREQIEAGALYYIAHQLDYFGYASACAGADS